MIQTRRNVSHARVYIRIRHSILQNYYVPNVLATWAQHTHAQRTHNTHSLKQAAATGRNAMKWKHNKTHHITCSHLSQSKLTLCIYGTRAGVHLCSRSVPHTHRHAYIYMCADGVLPHGTEKERDNRSVFLVCFACNNSTAWWFNSGMYHMDMNAASLYAGFYSLSLSLALSNCLPIFSLAQDTHTNKHIQCVRVYAFRLQAM